MRRPARGMRQAGVPPARPPRPGILPQDDPERTGRRDRGSGRIPGSKAGTSLACDGSFSRCAMPAHLVFRALAWVALALLCGCATTRMAACRSRPARARGVATRPCRVRVGQPSTDGRSVRYQHEFLAVADAPGAELDHIHAAGDIRTGLVASIPFAQVLARSGEAIRQGLHHPATHIV